jgi:hypothetical protein
LRRRVRGAAAPPREPPARPFNPQARDGPQSEQATMTRENSYYLDINSRSSVYVMTHDGLTVAHATSLSAARKIVREAGMKLAADRIRT